MPIRDVEAIKKKILFFYENPDKVVEMGENALEQARTSLSWDDYGDKIHQAYAGCLAPQK
jgi:glycosyltransferase involved in cell wall biosynthesis